MVSQRSGCDRNAVDALSLWNVVIVGLIAVVRSSLVDDHSNLHYNARFSSSLLMFRIHTAECPICLDGMSDADVAYPLLCPSNCGYNFCLSCVEHLVVSSKDDYQMASDGNRHVKIWLHCPQCRGNLTHSITDTIMLRKAKTAEKFREVADSELNATELRLKHEYITLYAHDVQHAEARLIKFHTDNGKTDELPAPLSFEHEEDGKKPAPVEKSLIDTTLFQGLESVMSDDEREYVQNLFISGYPQNLANGAQILNGILQLTLQGMAPKNTTQRSWNDERKHIERMELFRKRYPLPARMPKYYVLNSFPISNRTIMFEDEQWDGSIADAFSRVHVRKPKPNPGMDDILRDAESTHLPPRARVKISSVKGQAGKVGLQKGDVVTHIGGEPFDGTSGELKSLIASFYVEDPSSTFQIVVNADECTAEVLKLRYQKCRKGIADIERL